MANKPKIVVLCGSSKFIDIMAVCAWILERDEGAIAMGLHLLPVWYSAEEIPDHLAEHEGVADAMDTLHLRKIDIADEVFVVNFGGYIGESTSREIEHAKRTCTPIRYFVSRPGEGVGDPVGDQVAEIIVKYIEIIVKYMDSQAGESKK